MQKPNPKVLEEKKKENSKSKKENFYNNNIDLDDLNVSLVARMWFLQLLYQLYGMLGLNIFN